MHHAEILNGHFREIGQWPAVILHSARCMITENQVCHNCGWLHLALLPDHKETPAWCGNEARLHFQGTLAGHLHSGFWRYLQLWYMMVSRVFIQQVPVLYLIEHLNGWRVCVQGE